MELCKCGKGSAEHEFTTIRDGAIITVMICTECLMADDGRTDVNADIDPEEMAESIFWTALNRRESRNFERMAL